MREVPEKVLDYLRSVRHDPERFAETAFDWKGLFDAEGNPVKGPTWQQRDAKLFGQRVAKVTAAQSGDRQCAGGNDQRLAGECLARTRDFVAAALLGWSAADRTWVSPGLYFYPGESAFIDQY